jgi:hypothetical protein
LYEREWKKGKDGNRKDLLGGKVGREVATESEIRQPKKHGFP